jgi:hypothetical protein
MNKSGEFGFEHKGIGQALTHNRLTVPLNQREYAWEEEHVKDLFQDFSNAIAGDGTYFLGTIVLTQGEGEGGGLEVSDGQQRLATTTILLAAIRDNLHSSGNTRRSQALQKFLGEIDYSTEKLEPKLTLNVDDNDFFVKRILSTPDSADRGVKAELDSHRKIEVAARLAAEHVANILKPHGADKHAERLGDWVSFIEKGAQVILLTVPDHLNAFVMFETLNDRGLKASQADLLKNHLLHRSGKKIRAAQQKWAQMLGVLESIGEEDVTVTYLRYALIALYGPTKEREVFNRVKESIASEGSAIDFLDMLKDSAGDYVALLNPSHSKWNSYPAATRRHVAQLLELKAEQIRPLLFAVAKFFPPKEAAKAFRLFVNWTVRFLIAGGGGGGLLDKHYSARAHEVGTKAVVDAAGLIANMKNVVPTDAVFEAAFADAWVSRNFLARYYLRALELKEKGELEPELVPNDEANVVNLEHILPENPGTNWPGVSAALAESHYKRLGNLALLQAKKNSLAGNESFATKKPIYAASAFLLTQDVAKNSAWTDKEIQERQKKLAAIAVKTWPLDVS